MATLHVRNVPDELYEELRASAEREGRSIGAEAIMLLRFALDQRAGILGGLGERRQPRSRPHAVHPPLRGARAGPRAARAGDLPRARLGRR